MMMQPNLPGPRFLPLLLAILACLSILTSCRQQSRTPSPEDADTEWGLQPTEDPARDATELTKTIMSTLDARPGMQVADIGAGWGYHVFKVARLVAPDGKVYATDIEEAACEIMERYRDEHGHSNVEVIHVEHDEHGMDHIGKDSLDRVLMVNAIKFGDGPRDREELRYLSSIVDLIVPGGFLLYVDGQIDQERVKRLFLEAGFSEVVEIPHPELPPEEMYRENHPESYEKGVPFSFILKAVK